MAKRKRDVPLIGVACRELPRQNISEEDRQGGDESGEE